MGRYSRLGYALYEGDVSVNFVGRKRLWYSISGVILALAFVGLFVKGLNLGVEFQGGVEISVPVGAGNATQPTADKVRDAKLMNRRYDVQGAPTIVVNGRYRVDPTMVASPEAMIEEVNFLVERELKKAR